MGFSTSGAVAIILLGALVAVGTAYPAVQAAHSERQSAVEDRDDRTLELQNTAIELEAATYDSDTDELSVSIENAGSTTLSIPHTHLLVDGELESQSETTVVLGEDADEPTDRERWQPGDTLTIELSTDEPERVKVVTQRGVAVTTTDVEVS